MFVTNSIASLFASVAGASLGVARGEDDLKLLKGFMVWTNSAWLAGGSASKCSTRFFTSGDI